jgi:hypothetical protein
LGPVLTQREEVTIRRSGLPAAATGRRAPPVGGGGAAGGLVGEDHLNVRFYGKKSHIPHLADNWLSQRRSQNWRERSVKGPRATMRVGKVWDVSSAFHLRV